MKPAYNLHQDVVNEMMLAHMIFNELKDALEKCKTEWKQHIDKNFATEGGMVGGWLPINGKTKLLREALGYSPYPILDMRGKLKNSFGVFEGFDGVEVYVDLVWGDTGGEGPPLKDWKGDNLADIQHFARMGMNPLNGEIFKIPVRRELYDDNFLRQSFNNIVKADLDRAVNAVSMLLLGGK
jgi:hypothetical protein